MLSNQDIDDIQSNFSMLAVSVPNFRRGGTMTTANQSSPFGFMLQVSTPQNAVVYGSGAVPITTMIRSGVSFDIIGAILIMLLLPLMIAVVGVGG